MVSVEIVFGDVPGLVILDLRGAGNAVGLP